MINKWLVIDCCSNRIIYSNTINNSVAEKCVWWKISTKSFSFNGILKFLQYLYYFICNSFTFLQIYWHFELFHFKLTVTGETLDGQAQLLSADDEDQGKADLLSMCQAWVPDEDDDGDMYLFTQVGSYLLFSIHHLLEDAAI